MRIFSNYAFIVMKCHYINADLFKFDKLHQIALILSDTECFLHRPRLRQRCQRNGDNAPTDIRCQGHPEGFMTHLEIDTGSGLCLETRL